MENLGKKIRDIGKLVDLFEAQEGEIQHITGKIGNGKTYEGTRRALEDLKMGRSVYTTWRLILPDYYDEREDFNILFWKTVLFRKTFFRFDYKENWNFLDIDRPDLTEFVSKLTDCVVYLDEGQDVFDSRERIDKESRKVITRTRHLRKTLVIISQRAQAVDVTARANVSYYFKCVKTRAWYFPFKTYFKIYRTEELDDNNYPIWEDVQAEWKAELWHSHFARNEVYRSYNSWYLRAGIPRSQEVGFEAYDLNFFEKLKGMFFSMFGKIDTEKYQEMFKKNLEETAEHNKKKWDLEEIARQHKKDIKSRKKSVVLPKDFGTINSI